MWFNGKKFAQIALEVLALKKLKSRETQVSAAKHIPRLISHFGEYRIHKITEASWNDYVVEEKKKKPRKFFDDRKYMTMILLHAIEQGHIKKKPRLFNPDPPWDAGREIPKEEIQRLWLAASSELRFQMEIALKMGLRLREMLRLRFDQFDWKENTVEFIGKGGRKRIVPIPAPLLNRFKAKRDNHESRFVFPSPKDPARAQDNNKTAWRKCKAKAGVKARWHDLRHTCATQMLRKGVPIHLASRYLGMSEAVLKRIYLHLNIGDLRVAAKVMSRHDGIRKRRP